jgi:tRNA(fMet)-specific endonuclease VapC
MQPIKPIISYVTQAELLSLAHQRDWGKAKRDQLGFLLDSFSIIPIERPEILNTYILIDAYSAEIGNEMGKNDVWIAATARATAATLLTTDRDFIHLSRSYIDIEWIDPLT